MARVDNSCQIFYVFVIEVYVRAERLYNATQRGKEGRAAKDVRSYQLGIMKFVTVLICYRSIRANFPPFHSLTIVFVIARLLLMRQISMPY
ncbi:hypothetical protein TNCT_244271 [Trichonephila clavata]|uniref:Uncharacterized protein n=1 Tax=Trichonephila clavata TaxID=2740835 RepID=A0A8X6GC89_TRICU|nr:hypothetical protein TNCT_244271 [Trichonephila clavata]